MKYLFHLTLILILCNTAKASDIEVSGSKLPVRDGPYVFMVDNQLKIKWIQNDIVRQSTLTEKNFKKYRKKFGLHFDYPELRKTLSEEPVNYSCHTEGDSIAVLGDIHGEYNLYIDALRSAGVIDHAHNWQFGTGHLVIMGDVFDRGDKVTESFWHLYGLEKQAERAGGKVHVLLGNHEMLVFDRDLRYLNDKYRKVEVLTGTNYSSLYSDSSVIGHWLRQKPVMININNILFVHGGISEEMVSRKMSIEDVNSKFMETLREKRDTSVCSDEDLEFLGYEDGPVWYRGYFTDTTFCESRVDSIMSFYGARYIVVGHTPHRSITVRFGGKIIATDTGLMYHRPGEILIYKNETFYRVTAGGTRTRII